MCVCVCVSSCACAFARVFLEIVFVHLPSLRDRELNVVRKQ